ncbi:MAG: reverse transcriptase-like protein [Armatimonadetes bacterium]|nr:reverse transcriptase-like protein [Armatimonadota bacterium]
MHGNNPIRVLTSAYFSDEGPSGIGVLAVNAPVTSVGSVCEQTFGGEDELHFRSILRALQLGKELGAKDILILSPSDKIVKLVNREIALEPGGPLALLYIRIRALIYTYDRAEIRAVSRSRVRAARKLATQASRMPVRSSNPQRELFAAAG